MTALEIIRNSFDRFEDQKDITALSQAIFCVEDTYSKRDEEGHKIGGFEPGVFAAVADEMWTDFVCERRRSQEIIELCIEVVGAMKY